MVAIVVVQGTRATALGHRPHDVLQDLFDLWDPVSVLEAVVSAVDVDG